MSETVIERTKKLVLVGYKISSIESASGLPKNNLSNFLSGAKKMCKSNQDKLGQYLDKIEVNGQNNVKNIPEWVSVIENHCKNLGIEPLDLIKPIIDQNKNTPKENSMAFYKQHECQTWAELEEKINKLKSK